MLRWVAITVLFVPGATAAMWLEADSTPEGLLDPEVDVLDLAFTLHVDCQHLWLRDAALEPVPAAITFEAPPEVAFWHPPQKFIPSCDPTQTTSETTIDAQVAVSRQAVGLQAIPVTVVVDLADDAPLATQDPLEPAMATFTVVPGFYGLMVANSELQVIDGPGTVEITVSNFGNTDIRVGVNVEAPDSIQFREVQDVVLGNPNEGDQNTQQTIEIQIVDGPAGQTPIQVILVPTAADDTSFTGDVVMVNVLYREVGLTEAASAPPLVALAAVALAGLFARRP